MSESLSRDALIEKVADELTGCPIWGNAAAFGSDDAWTIADRTMRRVLRAVADDLEAWADDEDCGCQTTADWTVCDCSVSLTANGVRDAAERVRDLLGKETA